MRSHACFRIRMAALAMAFAVGIVAPAGLASALERIPRFSAVFLLGGILFALMLVPFAVLATIGVQSFNPMTNKVWELPTHGSNPFRVSNPLVAIHFAGFLFGAFGLGTLVSGLWRGAFVAGEGLLILLFGASLLLGEYLAVRVFRHRIDQAEGRGIQPLRRTDESS